MCTTDNPFRTCQSKVYPSAFMTPDAPQAFHTAAASSCGIWLRQSLAIAAACLRVPYLSQAARSAVWASQLTSWGLSLLSSSAFRDSRTMQREQQIRLRNRFAMQRNCPSACMHACVLARLSVWQIDFVRLIRIICVYAAWLDSNSTDRVDRLGQHQQERYIFTRHQPSPLTLLDIFSWE